MGMRAGLQYLSPLHDWSNSKGNFSSCSEKAFREWIGFVSAQVQISTVYLSEIMMVYGYFQR